MWSFREEFAAENPFYYLLYSIFVFLLFFWCELNSDGENVHGNVSKCSGNTIKIMTVIFLREK